MDEIILTEEGYRKLREELNKLYAEKQDINQELQETREQGDLSENAGYQYAKEKQLRILRRISDLELMIKKAKIVNLSEVKKDEVRIGAKVKIIDNESKEEKVYSIVSSIESDPLNGKISIDSPLAKGLIGAKVGETRQIILPTGKKEFTVLNIEY
ncbi:MAG: transcription elongation factor GreA [Elusimicrobiota bacterium]